MPVNVQCIYKFQPKFWNLSDFLIISYFLIESLKNAESSNDLTQAKVVDDSLPQC